MSVTVNARKVNLVPSWAKDHHGCLYASKVASALHALDACSEHAFMVARGEKVPGGSLLKLVLEMLTHVRHLKLIAAYWL